jgi:hypothetical protein
LVPSRTPWKGSGKTQNVAPFLDKVHDPVKRIGRQPGIGIGRQFVIPDLGRVLWTWIAVSQSLSSRRLALSRSAIFSCLRNAKLSGFSDGVGSHRSGRQLLCLCQSRRCPGQPNRDYRDHCAPILSCRRPYRGAQRSLRSQPAATDFIGSALTCAS